MSLEKLESLELLLNVQTGSLEKRMRYKERISISKACQGAGMGDIWTRF